MPTGTCFVEELLVVKTTSSQFFESGPAGSQSFAGGPKSSDICGRCSRGVQHGKGMKRAKSTRSVSLEWFGMVWNGFQGFKLKSLEEFWSLED